MSRLAHNALSQQSLGCDTQQRAAAATHAEELLWLDAGEGQQMALL
jgi:hypothetical protein